VVNGLALFGLGLVTSLIKTMPRKPESIARRVTWYKEAEWALRYSANLPEINFLFYSGLEDWTPCRHHVKSLMHQLRTLQLDMMLHVDHAAVQSIMLVAYRQRAWVFLDDLTRYPRVQDNGLSHFPRKFVFTELHYSWQVRSRSALYLAGVEEPRPRLRRPLTLADYWAALPEIQQASNPRFHHLSHVVQDPCVPLWARHLSNECEQEDAQIRASLEDLIALYSSIDIHEASNQ
jgi:hypothetical protein